MKKEISLHFGLMVVFFLLVSLVRGWFDIYYWQFWVGGIIGTILPDIDHLIYVYGFRPNDLASRRIAHTASPRTVPQTLDLLYKTRDERTRLILHNSLFQIVFVIFAFMMVGSRSPLAVGIALAFLLHLLTDQLTDFLDKGTIKSWFYNLNINLDKNGEAIYWLVMLSFLLGYGLLY